MDSKHKPVSPSLNQTIGGLVVGINHSQETNMNSFFESRIDYLILKSRSSHILSTKANNLDNHHNYKINTTSNQDDHRFEPISPQKQQQQFQQWPDQLSVLQTQPQQLLTNEELLKYKEQILFNQKILTSQSQLVHQMLLSQSEQFYDDKHSIQSVNKENHQSTQYHQNVPQTKRFNQTNAQKHNTSVQNQTQKKEQHRLYDQKLIIEEIDLEGQQTKIINQDKGKICFKVVIALKNIYQQQVRWACIDKLGIDSKHLENYTVTNLKQSILKLFNLQLNDNEKISVFFKCYGSEMVYLNEDLTLDQLVLNNRSTIKIFQQLIPDSCIIKSFHPQIKNPKSFITKPSLFQLRNFSEEKLKSVNNLEVKTPFGEIRFLKPVDLSGLILDEIIIFDQDSVEFYPKGSVIQPKLGKGLNVPCLIKFYNFGKLEGKDYQNDESFRKRVELWTQSMKMKIMGFKDGSLSVQLEHV